MHHILTLKRSLNNVCDKNDNSLSRQRQIGKFSNMSQLRQKLRQIGKIPNVSSRRRQGIYTTYIYIHAVAVALLASPAHHVATQRWVGFKGPNPHRVDDMTSDPTNLSFFFDKTKNSECRNKKNRGLNENYN